MSDVSGVVVTGVYGVGKSSVVEEMAEQLEDHGVAYAAIDVDWLWWFDIPGFGDDASRQILFENLKTIVGNYADAGVKRFLLAWLIRDQEDLDALREAMPFPLRVIALTAPLEVIKERLASAVAGGRKKDLQNAERWLLDGKGSEVCELEIANDRPIGEVANEILDLLEWKA